MSPKRALLLAGCAVLVGSLGGALTLGSPAAGYPAVRSASVHHAVHHSRAAATQPQTTLAIPTVIHLLDSTTGSVRPTSSRVVTSAALTKKGKAAGGAVYTCTFSSGQIGSCDAAFALAGGMFLVHLSHQSDGSFKGAIRQGTGKYAGASGSAHLVPTSGGKGKLTISYATG
ncbi:MAG: hypothetical protein ACTHK4_14515 [Mycobacteriales bacterium]